MFPLSLNVEIHSWNVTQFYLTHRKEPIRCHQNRPGSDGNEGILCFPQMSSITGDLDCLMSYPGHSSSESYPSAVMQSVYSTAPANWATIMLGGIERYCCHTKPPPTRKSLSGKVIFDFTVVVLLVRTFKYDTGCFTIFDIKWSGTNKET